MEPREETIPVGGVDVHVWKGGRGDPLLVLHGAGGNRGFTRWLRRVAERFTVWAPTHPGYGRSGDADWMETVDDLARFYLWFIDTAGLGRPHVLGQSIGGWTAAEMAAMSPGAIDRLVLVSPAGLKPETGEILDIFYYPAAQVRAITVHDPKTIPEWEELQQELGIGHLLLEAQESRMDHPTTMRSIELMGAKVIPSMGALA